MSKRAILPLVAAWLLMTVLAVGQAPTERAPHAKCEPHEVYRWRSKDGLDFTYSVPPAWFAHRKVEATGKNANKAKAEASADDDRCLVVLCHGTGLDYRWGHANHAPETMRPDAVVVAVSGPSEGAGGSRLFLGNDKDRKAFRRFLDELRSTFSPSRIFLYGHSQGGFFVLDFAGAFPNEVDGIVAHASGAWASSATPKALQKVPIVLMHGSSDPVVPYGQSVGTRDAYDKLGMTTLLRRLEFYNHWPNEVRTHEMLWWCDGMSCASPERALEAVRELLRERPADRYQWQTVPAFAAARRVLRRFESGGDLAESDPVLVRAADKLTKAIEKHGAEHVAVLEKLLRDKKSLVLQSATRVGQKKAKTVKPWIGWVLALREDFRGVDTVEALWQRLDFDKVLADHAKAAQKLLRSYYNDKDDKKIWLTVMRELPSCFLYDGLPSNFIQRMEDIRGRANEVGLAARDLAAGRLLGEWREGVSDGSKNYKDVWEKWRLPK